LTPAPSTAAIGRALRRLGLTGNGHRRPGRREYRRWERGAPMELWQLDVMGGVQLADGTEVKAVTGIDDHSRFCVAFGLVERATARPVCAVFAQALRTHGVPDEVLTDNGKVFTGRYGLRPMEVLFDRICRENGIAHRLTAPRSPTTTGKIERFHGTVRRELLNGLVFDSKAHAQAVIDAWVVEYNTDRPHQSLGRATPAQRFSAAHVDAVQTGPGLRLTALADDRAGDDWVSRRVASNGVISVAWQQVSVGKHRGGEVVDVPLMLSANLPPASDKTCRPLGRCSIRPAARASARVSSSRGSKARRALGALESPHRSRTIAAIGFVPQRPHQHMKLFDGCRATSARAKDQTCSCEPPGGTCTGPV
jgi:transposase InsO family protein